MAWLGSFSSIHNHCKLLAFQGYVREFTLVVNSSCTVMILWLVIFVSWVSISVCASMGNLQHPYCTRGKLGSTMMFYSPGMSPVQVKGGWKRNLDGLNVCDCHGWRKMGPGMAVDEGSRVRTCNVRQLAGFMIWLHLTDISVPGYGYRSW